LLEGTLAEVDVVFEVGFEGAEHLGPAHAVAVGAVEAALGFAPAGFRDFEEGVVGVERLEGHLYGCLVAGGWRYFAFGGVGWFVGVPLEDDLFVANKLLDGDGDFAGVVGEAPDDGGAFVERGCGSAGREVAAEFRGVVDGIEDFGYRLLDLGVNLEFELHAWYLS
jgi:hypothetical protein